MPVRLGALAAVCLVAAPALASAGPWTPAPGHGYLKVGLRALPGLGYSPHPDDPYFQDEVPTLYAPYLEAGAQTYVEVGIAPRLAATLSWEPIRTFLLYDPVDDKPRFFAAVGEPHLGARVQFAQMGRVALAAEGWFSIPIQSNDPVAPVYSIAEEPEQIGELRIARGAMEGYGGLAAGLGFGRIYGAASFGVQKATVSWDTVLRWGFEVGGRVGRSGAAQGRIKIAGYHSLDDGTEPTHTSPSGLGNGTSYVGATLELDREIREGWYLSLSLAGGLGGLRRQTGGPVLGLAVARVW